MQSLPSLWNWAVVMVTNPLGRATLLETAWRLAVVLAIGLGLEWLVWRGLRRSFVSLNAVAPSGSRDDGLLSQTPSEAGPADGRAAEDEPEEGLARAEEGETELRVRRGPSAWTILRRVPLVLARLLLEALPIIAFGVAGHLAAGSALGGNRLIRLVLLAVVDAYVAPVELTPQQQVLPGNLRERIRSSGPTVALPGQG